MDPLPNPDAAPVQEKAWPRPLRPLTMSTMRCLTHTHTPDLGSRPDNRTQCMQY